MKISRIENTKNWLKDYSYGNNFRDMPELNLIEENEAIKNKSIIMLPEFNGISALVLSFKKTGSLVLVPLSEYAHPANDIEVFLPNSNIVLQTWNSRIVEKSALGQILNMGMLSQADMNIAQSHYLAVFNEEEFDFPSLVGESICSLDEELAGDVLYYIDAEAELLPEDIFVVLDTDLSSYIFEESEEQDLENEVVDFESIIMPELKNYNSSLNLRNAAKPKKK